MTPNKGGRKYVMKGEKDKRFTFINLNYDRHSWIEMWSVPEARADLVANQVELAWLTRYHLPVKII